VSPEVSSSLFFAQGGRHHKICMSSPFPLNFRGFQINESNVLPIKKKDLMDARMCWYSICYIHCRVHNSLPLIRILSQKTAAHANPVSPSGLYPSPFPTKILNEFSSAPMHAICSAHHNFLDLIILVIFGEEYVVRTSFGDEFCTGGDFCRKYVYWHKKCRTSLPWVRMDKCKVSFSRSAHKIVRRAGM
jgi:hypothetical protein